MGQAPRRGQRRHCAAAAETDRPMAFNNSEVPLEIPVPIIVTAQYIYGPCSYDLQLSHTPSARRYRLTAQPQVSVQPLVGRPAAEKNEVLERDVQNDQHLVVTLGLTFRIISSQSQEWSF